MQMCSTLEVQSSILTVPDWVPAADPACIPGLTAEWMIGESRREQRAAEISSVYRLKTD
jgi:hypothetical protein